MTGAAWAFMLVVWALIAVVAVMALRKIVGQK